MTSLSVVRGAFEIEADSQLWSYGEAASNLDDTEAWKGSRLGKGSAETLYVSCSIARNVIAVAILIRTAIVTSTMLGIFQMAPPPSFTEQIASNSR